MKRANCLRWSGVELLTVMILLVGCSGESPEAEVPACESLFAVFDGTDCDVEGCWNWVECNCSGYSFSWFTCRPSEGCLVDLDCRAACSMGRLGVQECVSSSYCSGDAQCEEGQVCVIAFGLWGICLSGDVGLPCFEDGDCVSGYCRFAGQAIGICNALGGLGDPCDEDKACQSKICMEVQLEEGSSQVCSAGQIGDHCLDDGDCREGECYFPPEAMGFCSEGLPPGAPCESDEDCMSRLCVRTQDEVGYSHICTRGMLGDQCEADEDCVQGLCQLYIEAYGVIRVCTEEDVRCIGDDQCPGGFCNIWGSLEEGTCTDGNEGDACFDDGDCWTGICIHYQVEIDWYYECMDGSPGDPCVDGEDCQSGTCAKEIQATGVYFFCD